MLRRTKLTAAVAAVALTVAACGSSSDDSKNTAATDATSTTAAMAQTVSVKSADDLRSRLNYLLGDHIILASKATGAALGGRSDEFTAYGTQLNTNGTDIGSLIGAAFGSDAQTKFNGIWSAHNGYFVDYTTATAKQDKAGQDKAVSDLTGNYVPQFTDFLVGATGLPSDTVKGLVTEHVLQTKAIVDDQYAKNWTKAVADVRTAYAHMKMMGDPLSQAIAAKKADLFPGSASTKASDLRTTINQALQEHLYLATFATDAALGGRTDEYSAYGAALNKNGTEIGTLLGSVYGADAQTKFNGIWSAHNGYFVDYTTATAKQDKTAQDKAVSELTGTYVPQFTDFIAGATDLPSDTVKGLVTEHVTTTKQVVDDQYAKDWTKTATDDRAAAMHMQMLGDPLAAAIVKKFPSKFNG